MSARTLLNFRRVVFRDMYQRSKISQESVVMATRVLALKISEVGFKVSRGVYVFEFQPFPTKRRY